MDILKKGDLYETVMTQRKLKIVYFKCPIIATLHIVFVVFQILTIMALCHEGVWGSGCIDPHFLDFSTSWR
jgi:hypothetical protein